MFQHLNNGVIVWQWVAAEVQLFKRSVASKCFVDCLQYHLIFYRFDIDKWKLSQVLHLSTWYNKLFEPRYVEIDVIEEDCLQFNVFSDSFESFGKIWSSILKLDVFEYQLFHTFFVLDHKLRQKVKLVERESFQCNLWNIKLAVTVLAKTFMFEARFFC